MKDKVLMVVFILILGAVLTTALVGVDYYTADRIKANKLFKLRTRVLDALNIPCAPAEVEAKFQGSVETKLIGEKNFYTSQDGNVAFEFNGSGLWGPIHGVLALSSDLKTIKGLTIIHQEETPGLGGRISEADFLNKFRDKDISSGLVITPPDRASAVNEVDGITGATLTSKAFGAIINSQAKEYRLLYEKGN
ncbi:FMN-binding protein [Candidatus Poribacteria bacterium]